MIILEMIVVIGLILINAVMAMSEMAVVSSRKARLQQMAANGSRGAKVALGMLEDPTNFLSTVQIGITLVGISAGAFSGAALGDRLGDWLEQFEFLAAYSDGIGTGVVVLVITYLSLIVGELVPKRIALVYAEQIAAAIALPMHGLAIIAAPAVWLLRHSTEGALNLLRINKRQATGVTEEEVKTMVAEGTASGVFEQQERDMIEGVLRLADRTAKAVMTPRIHVAWIDRNATLAELSDVFGKSAHSRLLVCDGAVDHPVGVVQAKFVMPLVLNNQAVKLADVMEPAPFVDETTPVLQILDRFKREHIHIAIVMDQQGMMEGIITITDILESIAGGLPENSEDASPMITRRDDGSLLVDGSMLIDAFEDALGVSKLSESDTFHTMAGLVLEQLGRVPQEGDTFLYRGYEFEVVDMDGRRIDKLLLTPQEAPPA
jgi:putative hemolysin